MLGLKSTSCCVLSCWLTIYSILTSFFLATASRWQVLRMYSALAGPVLWCWTDVRLPNWHEAQPGLQPAKRCRQRSPRNSSLANIAVDPPESGILLTAAGWFQRCRPALNPLNDFFFVRIILWTQGPNDISKALGRPRHQHVCQQKPTSDGLNPQNLALILPGSLLFALCCSVRPTPTFNSFFMSKIMFLLLLSLQKSLYCSDPCRILSDDSAASHLHCDRGSAHPLRYVYTITQTAAQQILFIFPLTAPQL